MPEISTITTNTACSTASQYPTDDLFSANSLAYSPILAFCELGPEPFHFEDLSSFYSDSRSSSIGSHRQRTHLKKYSRTNSGSRVAPKPIPYNILLNTPNYEIVPELKLWRELGGCLGQRFDYLLPPEGEKGNNPPGKDIGNATTLKAAEKRRIYALGKVAKQLTLSDRCSCFVCRRRRAEIHNKFAKKRWNKVEFEEEETRAENMTEWYEYDTIWDWMRYDELDCLEHCFGKDDGGIAPIIDQPQNNWAKLVDDAVCVWEDKRRKEVERLGWEVCSSDDHDVDHDDIDGEWSIVSV